MKFYTYEKAIQERNKLNKFIILIEQYNIKSFENWVVKQYAISGSVIGVIKHLSFCPFSIEHLTNNREDIKAIILSPAKDELHRLVQKHYKQKARYKKQKAFDI